MNSKRFKKLTKDSNTKGDIFSKLISEIKKNCTFKFDESIDLSLQIFNKKKKNEINIRTSVNLPSGTGKWIYIIYCIFCVCAQIVTPSLKLEYMLMRFVN